MKQRGLGLTLVGCSLSIAAAAAAEADPGISVTVSQLRNGKGVVRCALFKAKDGFPSDSKKALRVTATKIEGKKAVCAFRELPEGRYALAAYHDEDNNNEMKTNFLGIPQEGVAASNNAKGSLGPPSFEDAAFNYKGPRFEQTIRIAY